MDDADRFRLLGTYRTPRFRIGQRVCCQVRGEVVITGMTEAPIPWPIGKGDRGQHSLLVYKGLARAVCRTLAPRGQTPILDAWDRRDRLLAVSCITVSPRRHCLNLYFELRPKNANVYGEDVVVFLRRLRQALPGPLTVPQS
jgi:hypothetical protein